VFTRIMLALFGFIPWRAVPMMPIEIMLLPKWFPFHLDKISYWSRTVIVPLLVLMAKRPVARNAKGVRIDELFLGSPENLGPTPKAPQQKASWFWIFRGVDIVLRVIEPLLLRRLPSHQRAIDRAVAWVGERLNGEDGLGGIFPAMANSVMMFDVLGLPESHPQRAIARASVEKLLVVHEHEAYCQPCVSPIWDTGLACHALLEAGGERAVAQVKKGLDWLTPTQVLDVRGDWIARRPNLRPGGWAFQYANPHYPDVDDTAVVAMAMDRVQKESGREDFRVPLARAREWVVGMQSDNGAWGAFDADNEFYYLNNIPFADHGALLDPPTEDVTARCVSMLAQFGERSPALQRGLDYLARTQLADGSWYGRWGMNYIYGTWSVLCCLNAAGLDPAAPVMGKAADWLVSIQNADGGWGEDGASYKLDYHGYERAPSTASQTAWALIGLMAAGAAGSPAVKRGIDYLQRTQGSDGLWAEERYTATGFPRVFYLRYHGYAKYFPLWALARYRNLMHGQATTFGM
jgi:squalene-hopene/tetraprenyl-beta-curcumene cyclase